MGFNENGQFRIRLLGGTSCDIFLTSKLNRFQVKVLTLNGFPGVVVAIFGFGLGFVSKNFACNR